MLSERIEILREADVISEKTSLYVLSVIEQLEHEFSEKEQILEMFTTHLAMCIQRVLDHEEVEELDDFLWKQVEESSSYGEANKLLQKLLIDAPCEIPEGEKKFLLMHLCNLYQWQRRRRKWKL